ncbi:uncharacterized protein [Elaeis guineensis]|uniref:Uncharacterized protein LOC105043012 n=1 Tax=Elaeis guineensis var. tenera TaxID=51953 RepID=A0A6J0PIJ0_ELAGV|nr:uncharacterized protein LOC105043012 [Elaeis guineensis]XP_029119784.1 uncharacterized protein LOC105043012 [Elaeis guineensis]
MLEVGHDASKGGTAKYGDKDKLVEPGVGVDQLTFKLVQVEGDGTFIPSLEDDAMEVEHLLADPQSEKDLIVDVMHLNSENTNTFLDNEDFPCEAGCCSPKKDFGVLDSDDAHVVKQEPKYEYVENMMHGIEEEGILHLPYNLSSVCPDLLDIGFPESSEMDYASENISFMRNFGSECQTLSIERDDDAGEMLHLPNAIIPYESTSDCATSFLDNMSADELHDAFRSMFGRDTCVTDKQWLKHRILFGLQNHTEVGSASSLLECGLSSIENDDNMIWIPKNVPEGICIPLTNIFGSSTLVVGTGAGKEGHSCEDVPVANISKVGKAGFEPLNLEERPSALTASKRLRKPTRRYIEETSEMISRGCNERAKGPIDGGPIVSSRDKLNHVKTDNRGGQVVYQEYSPRSGIQVPNDLQFRRGRPKKNSTLMGAKNLGSKEDMIFSVACEAACASRLSQAELQDGLSDDCATSTRNEKSGIRRKHHRLWTLSEVMKLVEGVSRYGVGRWTEIKRLLFSSSAYRTSVDLKDKWRNLLRASGAQLHNRNQVESQKKHMSLPIPQSVLRRVKELSIIHPYPRDRKSRPPLVSTAACSNSISISRSGRTVHK